MKTQLVERLLPWIVPASALALGASLLVEAFGGPSLSFLSGSLAGSGVIGIFAALFVREMKA